MIAANTPARLAAGRGGSLLSVLLPDLDAVAEAPAPQPDPALLATTLAAEQAALLQAAHAEALGAARAEAEAAGRATALAEAAASREAEIAASLGAIADRIGAADDAAHAMAEAAAHALAGLLLASLEALAPQWAGHDAERAIAPLVEALLPGLRNEPAIRVLVAPDLVQPVAARLTDPRIDVLPGPALAPGDLRVEWRDGGAERRVTEQMAAVRAAWRAAGLATGEGQ